MDRFNALGRGMQIMLVASVLLLLDSFIFNWQEVSIDVLGVEASSGINAWHGFWGVAMGLLTIVLLAWLVARLAAVDIPVPVSLTGAVLAFLIFACALIKNLSDDYSTFWSYLGVGLAAVIAVGAWLQVQEAGGIETLKSEVPSMGSSGTTTASAPEPPAAAAPPPPPAPAAPEASPPEASPSEASPSEPGSDEPRERDTT